MKPSSSPLLLAAATLLLSSAAWSAPRAAPPPAPPKGRARLPEARPTPPGRILTLKPGQKRLTPEQLKLALSKTPAKPGKAARPAAKKPKPAARPKAAR